MSRFWIRVHDLSFAGHAAVHDMLIMWATRHASWMLCSLHDVLESYVLTANCLKCKYTVRINFIYGAGILDAVQANFAAAANVDIRQAIKQKLFNCRKPAAAKVV